MQIVSAALCGGGGYGLGLLSLDFGPECGGVYEGHDGGVPGYLSILLSTGSGERRLEVSVTIGAPDPDDPQAAERFWTAFNTLLLTAACGTTTKAPDASLVTPSVLNEASRAWPTEIQPG